MELIFEEINMCYVITLRHLLLVHRTFLGQGKL
jgi:hypothetical protein